MAKSAASRKSKAKVPASKRPVGKPAPTKTAVGTPVGTSGKKPGRETLPKKGDQKRGAGIGKSAARGSDGAKAGSKPSRPNKSTSRSSDLPRSLPRGVPVGKKLGKAAVPAGAKSGTKTGSKPAGKPVKPSAKAAAKALLTKPVSPAKTAKAVLAKLGTKVGSKVGSKVGTKVGAKGGAKVVAKVGLVLKGAQPSKVVPASANGKASGNSSGKIAAGTVNGSASKAAKLAAKAAATAPVGKSAGKPEAKGSAKAASSKASPPTKPAPKPPAKKKGPIDLSTAKSVAAVAVTTQADASGYVLINGRRVRMISTRGLPTPKRSKPAVEKEVEKPELQVSTIKTKMVKKELDEYRTLLLAKRRVLAGMLSGMEDEALRSSGGNLSTMPLHMADIGTDTFDQDFTLGMAETERVLLDEIDAALGRIENKTYGVCQLTGKPIPKSRLEAKPWAKHTVEAAKLVERGIAPR